MIVSIIILAGLFASLLAFRWTLKKKADQLKNRSSNQLVDLNKVLASKKILQVTNQMMLEKIEELRVTQIHNEIKVSEEEIRSLQSQISNTQNQIDNLFPTYLRSHDQAAPYVEAERLRRIKAQEEAAAEQAKQNKRRREDAAAAALLVASSYSSSSSSSSYDSSSSSSDSGWSGGGGDSSGGGSSDSW